MGIVYDGLGVQVKKRIMGRQDDGDVGDVGGGDVGCNVCLHRWTTMGTTTPRWVGNLIHANCQSLECIRLPSTV